MKAEKQLFGAPTEPQVYGPVYAPRFKFTCVRCSKRNDHALSVPLPGTLLRWCTFCRKGMSFTVSQRAPS